MNSFKLYWIFGVVLLSCTDMYMDDEIPPLSFRLAWEMGVKPLTKDGNGYLHMTINSSSWQTIKTLYGYVTRVGSEEGVNVIKFGWASSHYWVLGDTLGYIIDVGLDEELIKQLNLTEKQRKSNNRITMTLLAPQ